MNGVLLDTNVISEITRVQPDKNVVEFLSSLDRAWVSVLTLHELHYGIARLPEGKRRKALAQTIERFIACYEDFILAVNRPEAKRAADLRAQMEQVGRVMHLADALIAGTALEHDLTVATRNVSDFSDLAVLTVNPWE